MTSKGNSRRRLSSATGGRGLSRRLIIVGLFLLQQTCHPWPYLALTIFPKRTGNYLQQQHHQQQQQQQHTVAASTTPPHRYRQFFPDAPFNLSSSNHKPSVPLSWWQRVKKTSKLFALTSGDVAANLVSSTQKEQQQESVHLQLLEVAPNNNNNKNTNNKKKEKEKKPPLPSKMPPKKKNTMVKEFMYMDPVTNTTFKALNTCTRKFQAYLTYQGVIDVNSDKITTTNIELTPQEHAQKRIEWRDLWTSRQLLTDRTEFLAVYQSDILKQSPSSLQQPQQQQRRRGGFRDLLHLYTERLKGILEDEQEDQEGVLQWLTNTYGSEHTHQLLAPQFTKATQQEQLDRLQHFSEWFRSVLPYHYDRCRACGVSHKDETAAAMAADESKEDQDDEAILQKLEATETTSDDDDNGTFLGYIYPDDGELDGKASRTELYHCHKCHAFTRFPRFNAAQAIIQHKRGRCGEYSTLMYRLLRALGLEARWVVDWADHVWAEVLVGEGQQHQDTQEKQDKQDKQQQQQQQQRWVHIDPCEAAVDNNHLYQSWGKKQTYVMALYAPKTATATTTNGSSKQFMAPLVEDVTNEYTSDPWETIYKRRDESNEEVEQAITKAVTKLAETFGVSG